MFTRLRRARPAVLALCAVAALLLCSGLAWPFDASLAAASETEASPGRVAFVRDGDIWADVLPDGPETRLTTDGRSHAPRWSHSGAWLAYLKQPGDTSGQELWLVSASGQQARPIATVQPGVGTRVAWSPAEDVLAYVENDGIFLVAPGDATSRPLVAPGAGVQDLAWSPDGRQLAYALARASSTDVPPSRTAGIQWVWAEGGPPTEVIGADEPAESGFILAGWSPDASQILYWEYPLFSSSLLADGTPLMAVDAGGAPRQVAESMLAHADLLDWSADGQSLAVVAGAGRSTASQKTLVVTAPDVDPVQVSPAGQAVLSPAWSPDGTWIAYAAASESAGGAGTTPSMQRQIWLVRPDGTEAHPLTASTPPHHAELPRWSVDGQSLFYLRIVDAEAPRAQLWLADVEGTQQRLLVDNVSLGSADPGFYGYVDWDEILAWWQPPSQDGGAA